MMTSPQSENGLIDMILVFYVSVLILTFFSAYSLIFLTKCIIIFVKCILNFLPSARAISNQVQSHFFFSADHIFFSAH